MPSQTLPEQLPAEDSLLAEHSFNPARQAFLNGCVSLVKGVFSVLVIVALTPFLIRYLGSSGFGVWSLLGLVVNYVMLIDLGTSGAVAKFMGELSPREQINQLNDLFTSYMTLVGILAIGTVVVAVLLLDHRANPLEAHARIDVLGG